MNTYRVRDLLPRAIVPQRCPIFMGIRADQGVLARQRPVPTVATSGRTCVPW